jgi:SagB-type dehydrogenase family enzyme
MNNRQTDAAWAYHNGTKHSYASIRANRHYLDWENQPQPFKIYSDLQPIPLPQHLSSSGMPALDAIAPASAPADRPEPLTNQLLAELLFLSAGITRRRRHAGIEILFRAAACTGALYHIDLYVVCGDLADLAAGVYHFSPHDFALRRLRAGDHRAHLLDAAGDDPGIAKAPCVVVSASTFWRNAWKYQARAYRHCYWDNGTILANLLAAATARKIPAKLALGFVDAGINKLLALDNPREAPLSMIALGNGLAPALSAPAVEEIKFETEPLSRFEVDYPAMRAMHEASSLESKDDVIAWRNDAETAAREERSAAAGARIFPLQSIDAQDLPQDSIEQVILRRGSSRAFARVPITFAELSTMLGRATCGVDSDFRASDEAPLNELYLIVHAVTGLPAGAYVYRRREQALELLQEGDFRKQAGELGLGQEIPADCSVNIYFLADLNSVLARFGNRGYRAAQLEAAIIGGKIYLAAYAQRLGASGLTFFDDDVTEFFAPDAAGKSVMFLVAIGKSARRKQTPPE